MPDQRCRLLAGQPAIACLAFWRQRNANYASVKALFTVMVDRSTKRFEVATSAALVTPVFNVSAASLGVDRRQRLAAPEFVKASNSGENLELICRLSHVREVDREYIGAADIVDVSSLLGYARPSASSSDKRSVQSIESYFATALRLHFNIEGGSQLIRFGRKAYQFSKPYQLEEFCNSPRTSGRFWRILLQKSVEAGREA